MNKLFCYASTPVWHKANLENELLSTLDSHSNSVVKIEILTGYLELRDADGTQACYDIDQQVQPVDIDHFYQVVSCSETLELQLHFLCSEEDYFAKKYQLTRTHSEVIAAMQYLYGGKALDLGCGNGRNSLYLNLKGFSVSGFDRNSASIANLNRIITEEKLKNITAHEQDLSALTIEDNYEFILSTVVMMFLPPATVPTLIAQMQQHTKSGGVNLIVSAMDTDDYPCSVGFPFTFKRNELLNYYQGWDILKYNEDIGELHKLDEQGNRIKLRFATLLARKH